MRVGGIVSRVTHCDKDRRGVTSFAIAFCRGDPESTSDPGRSAGVTPRAFELVSKLHFSRPHPTNPNVPASRSSQ